MKYLKKFNESLSDFPKEDDDIMAECERYGIENYTVNSDGSIDVNGHVKIEDVKIQYLPLKFNYVRGDFIVREIKLKTLEGSPKKVGGDFDCSSNKLTSLEGGPEEVGGSFKCRYNYITTLEGGPKIVSGYGYDCSNNELTSLKGAPEEVGAFSCNNNELTTLEGGPKIVKEFYDCSSNELKSLKGAPEKLDRYLDCSYNKLTNFEGFPTIIRDNIYCNNNYNFINTDGLPEISGNTNLESTPLGILLKKLFHVYPSFDSEIKEVLYFLEEFDAIQDNIIIKDRIKEIGEFIGKKVQDEDFENINKIYKII